MNRLLKKLLAYSLFSVLAVTALSATTFSGDLLSKPHRIFQVGVDSKVMIANNLFGVEDILTKNVEVDLQKMADSLPNYGFAFSIYEHERVFVDLNISSRFRFSVFSDLESSGRLNVSKDLFDLLGSGISVGDTKTVDVEGFADVFYDMGFSFQTIIKGYGIKFTPSYYVPLVYVPKTKASAKVTTNKNGLIRTDAEANVEIYTAVSMHDFMEDEKTADNLNLNTADILSNGGFDFAIEVERNWLHGLNAGLYTRIPLTGGTLNYKMSSRFWAYAYETNTLGYLNKSEEHKADKGHDDFVYTEESYKAYRPLKFGLNATYMPFGDWFKIQPALGFAIRAPYTSEALFYPEYALDLNFSVLKHIFNFNLSTAYQQQVFQHRFGFALNLRALEILAQISMCGTGFMSTFHTAGYGAFAGVRIGF